MRNSGLARLFPGLAVMLALGGCARELDEEERAKARIEFYMSTGTGGNLVHDEKDPRRPIIGVDLARAPVLDAGLRPIGKLKSLRTLNLLGADRITDHGITFLEGLSNLETLDLSYTGLSGRGLEPLEALGKLQSLGLAGNPLIGDADLEYLAGLKNLRKLNLAGTAVTDAGLEHLLGLKALQELDLSTNPGISDEGLKRLRGLIQLRTLNVTNTAVTEEGVKALKAVRPRLTVVLPESG